ncbi:MAG: dockerin type I domain-containing protein [Saprospiraceae bacterium]
MLGIERLKSPYKKIAADVNNDNDISAIDLLELRKLILGIYDKLPDNTSWKFVPKSRETAISPK